MSRKPQKPKNRNKAYKPKKDQLTKDQIKQLIRKGKGTDSALRAHIEKFSELKPYELSMQWDIHDVNRTIDMYCLMNNVALNGDDPLPLEVLQSIYKGDLIVAIRRNLIPAEQHFKVTIHNMQARLINDHSVVVDIPDYVMDFNGLDPIDYGILMRGSNKEKQYHFKRDGVFKNTWKGLTTEWEKYLSNHYSDDYEICRAEAVMTCTTAFRTWNNEKQFQQLKLLGQVRKFV